jgi:hypothetical protein
MNDYADFPWLYVLSCVGAVITFFAGLLVGRETGTDRYEHGYTDGYEHGYQHGFNNRRKWRDRPVK